jgi:hypothetical protein
VQRASASAAVLIIATVAGACVIGGCSAGPGSGRASPGGCTAIAIRAARGQARISQLPAPCRGLGPEELSRTVKIAAGEVARHGTKSLRRHLAIVAYRRLGVLTAAADREAAARAAARASRAASRPHRPVVQASHGLSVPVGLAALAAWLLAAASGGLLVHRRLTRRPRRRLPPVLIAHLGLALTGLATWAIYLATGWAALAWAALGVLLPVAGLGMATLILAIPDPTAERVVGSGPGRPPSPTPSRWRGGAGLTVRDRAETQTPAAGMAKARRPPVLLIAAHGALATATILLALLGALAAVTAH